jgi:cytochrome b6-f complex iron-sulfur subunit
MASSRREFIKRSLYGLFALLGLGFFIPGIRIFSPAGDQSKKIVYFPLVPEEDIPRSGVKKSELVYTASGKERKARVFIVSNQGELLVLSATCSHLGCLVNYSREKGEFICPCHGGRYTLSGKNIAGPPPAPLGRIPARIENGMVMAGIKV